MPLFKHASTAIFAMGEGISATWRKNYRSYNFASAAEMTTPLPLHQSTAAAIPQLIPVGNNDTNPAVLLLLHPKTRWVISLGIEAIMAMLVPACTLRPAAA